MQPAGAPSPGTCELLQALQGSDSDTRKAAEKKLEEAIKAAPNQLVAELVAVLAACGNGGASQELRQQAVVLLRQCASASSKHDCWSELDSTTKTRLKSQLLVSLEQDPGSNVRRNAGSVITTIAGTVAEDFNELVAEWPELMPSLSNIIGAAKDATGVTACLGALKDLVPLCGEELLKQGSQAVTMLQNCISSNSPAEVQAAAAQLAFQMVEDLEEEAVVPLGPMMPAIFTAMQGFATNAAQEELLKETLESLISAADEEPEFFKKNGLQQLWPLLIEMCKAQHWADADVRHSAMEAAMSFAEGLCEDFCKPEGLPFLEQLMSLNIEWMLEVEENVDTWVANADKGEDDYELDGDTVEIGEENLDRLAEQCSEKDVLEDTFMPLLFKLSRTILAAPECSWKHVRSVVMAVSQVVEYVEDEDAWVDQCVQFLLPHLSHAHPRVRFSAFQAIGQVAYDHEPYVGENHAESLLPAIVKGLDDQNIRVATNAASALASVGDQLDSDELEPHLEALMTKLFQRLQQGGARTLQETCLSAIGVVGEAADELFKPYYSQVMPVLKSIMANVKADEQKTLRCKAFECASIIGNAVGKEIFATDAHELMQVMVSHFQAGFAADDQMREYVHEAAGRIAQVLEKDFKPYAGPLLQSVLVVLSQKPKEVNDDDEPDDEEEMTREVVDGKLVGLKTAVLDEMVESLKLISQLIEALGDEFTEFLAPTCVQLIPLLHFPLSADVQENAFTLWEHVVSCARAASEAGKCSKSEVGQLMGEFLKATVMMMTKLPSDPAEQDEASLAELQAQSTAVSGVIRKAGKGMLSKEAVVDLVKVLVELLGRVSVVKDEAAEAMPKKQMGKAQVADSDEEDSDAEDGQVTRQSVRFSLVDVAGALMRSSRAEFIEVGLPTFMELVKALLQGNNPSDAHRSLALYIADDVVECLAELSVPYWNIFMEHACNSITDKCAAVRQYAASVVGHGAKAPIFAQIAPAAAAQVARVLQKHGERHRRRRARNKEGKELALSVDSSIWALGMICEHQERNVGGDSTEAWKMWLTNMPLRSDKESAQKANAQLLELVVKGHPVVTAPEQLPRVLAIFADVYKSKYSNPVLDKEIAAAVRRAGEGSVQNFAKDLPERQQKKLEQMLKDCKDS